MTEQQTNEAVLMDTDNKRCIDLVGPALDYHIEELRKMYEAYCDPDNDDDITEDGDSIYEYGHAFNYVGPNTWEDQPDGYWRYQLSYGGPSEEFRYHDYGEIEFRYHDWFDGAGIVLTGSDLTFMRALAENFMGLTYQPSRWVREW